MSIPLDHARHNKKAAEYLHAANNEFPDWVVTTSFYCAMHYVYASMFPFTEIKETYNNFDQYYNKHKKTGDSKHGMTLTLVQKKLNCIANKYKQLKDIAFTSRYQDYQLPKEVVSQTRKNLKAIEEHCEKLCNPEASKTDAQATSI